MPKCLRSNPLAMKFKLGTSLKQDETFKIYGEFPDLCRGENFFVPTPIRLDISPLVKPFAKLTLARALEGRRELL